MTDDDSGVSLPSGLMDCGHHNDDMPRALRRTRSIVEEFEASGALNRPPELLHLQVIELQKTRPHVNAINHKYKCLLSLFTTTSWVTTETGLPGDFLGTSWGLPGSTRIFC